MKELKLTLSKSEVYAEVDKTTSYAGAKGGEEGSFAHISTTTTDHQMLDKWWMEACTLFADKVKLFMTSYGIDDGELNITLTLSSAYDTTLDASVKSGMFGFFVDYILQKWYTLIGSAQAAQDMTEEASVLMDDVMAKLFYRARPAKRS